MSETFARPDRIIDIHNHVRDHDPGGCKLLELMDAHGVETALLLGLPKQKDEDLLAALETGGRRMVGGAYYDPREGAGAIDRLRRFNDLGLRVVKLFPNLGYYPDDDELRPFFDAVAELGMAVLSHCGWLAPGAGVTAAYYSHPGRFEKLVRTYKETIFIFAHMGGIAGFLEAVMLTTRTPNAYVDCTPGQGVWVLETAGAMAASIPPDRLLWGADSYHYEEWIGRQEAAMVKLGFGPHLADIFHNNSRGLLERLGAIRPGQ